MIRNAEILDALIQGSTVELFHSYGVAAAPTPRSSGQNVALAAGMLAAATRFSGRGIDALLVLAVPERIVALTLKDKTLRSKDWVRELTNQLMGRIKNRLLRFQVALQTTLPTIVDPTTRSRGGAALVYVFRTLHGDLVVFIEGRVDEAALAFSASTDIAREGDIILF
jgi:hypothetical protein